MNRRRYEPLWQHTYRIFANGEVIYSTTSEARFRREAAKYGNAINVTFAEPRHVPA